MAHVEGSIVRPPRLDALLAYWVAMRAGCPMWARPDEMAPVEIPIAREPRGRFHLVSDPQYAAREREMRHKSRRPVIAEAQMLGGPTVKRIDIQTGPSKGFRIPYEICLLEGGAVLWWCHGDRDRVEELLDTALHLGAKRGVGHGWVERWQAEPCEPWPGFPVVRDGKPLRPLPLDWPGLEGPAIGLSNITFPYWNHATEQPCAIP